MEKTICQAIRDLIAYAEAHGLADVRDRVYFENRLAQKLHLSAFDEVGEPVLRPLEEILGELCEYAVAQGVIPDGGVTQRDLFDTELMGILTPLPSRVIDTFEQLYQSSPEAATNYYYRLACDSDYIRTYRVRRDLKWTYAGKYGTLDITVNLSKPEKDPKAIAAARSQKQSGYPKCALCRENEGFAGSLTQAARASHRLIPLTLDGKRWYLQYSPYVYYNEHCIVLAGEHTPMKIDRSTFVKQLDFITWLPHYFLGSNADLPIVGGSILTHDHMQGGHYTFAMERAEIAQSLTFAEYPDVAAGIVHWPMSVIRLRGADKARMVELADKILTAWRGYTDAAAGILAETDGEPHNTITPIARRRGADYELDLVLRNNLTTDEHPLGLYHPHADKHNIKKENIGLIEVMGLAVLPARLKTEMGILAELLAEGKDPAEDERVAKHAEWVKRFLPHEPFTKENTEEILHREIGRTFEGVLEDAGVYKCTNEGREAFLRFVRTVGGEKA